MQTVEGNLPNITSSPNDAAIFGKNSSNFVSYGQNPNFAENMDLNLSYNSDLNSNSSNHEDNHKSFPQNQPKFKTHGGGLFKGVRPFNKLTKNERFSLFSYQYQKMDTLNEPEPDDQMSGRSYPFRDDDRNLEEQPTQLTQEEFHLEKVEISFSNINYWIPHGKKGEKKQILNAVGGYCEPGKFLAIMGPSGAGKTTLLDVLACRNKSGIVDGSILFNGQPLVPQNFKHITGYVMQDDAFLSTLTVEETLHYIMSLRVSNLSKQERQERIETLLETLNIKHIAKSKIGSPLKRGISGGERKRLSIAAEMVTMPSLLFIDEPTTGLDSYNALKVMEAIKNLCLKGCTIVCTVHQPRDNIFNLFDKLLLLHQGKTIYFGDRSDVLSYFANYNLICPPYLNPADFLLDMLEEPEENIEDIGEEEGDNFVDSKQSFVSSFDKKISEYNFHQLFQNSEKGKALKTRLEREHCFGKQSSIANLIKSLDKVDYPIPIWKQSYYLTKRTFKAAIPDSSLYIRTAAALGIGLLVGGLFLNQPDIPDSAGSRVSTILFVMCVFSLFCLPAIGRFIEERLLYTREYASGYYHTIAYAIASFVVEFPILLLTVIGYGCIVYWMVGMEPSITSFIFFLGIIFLVIHVGFAWCQVLAAALKTTNMAIALYMLILVYSLLLGGFIVAPSTLSYMKWALYSSYIYYGFEALVINEFENRSYGKETLENLGFEGHNKYYNMMALILMFSSLRTVAYVFLRYLNKEKR